MKHFFIATITSFLAAFMTFTLHAAPTEEKEMHYRLSASDESLNPKLRLLYLDSLLSLDKAHPSDSLLFLSAEIAYSSGRYQHAIEKMLTMLEIPELPINKRCKAMFMLAKSQFKSDDEIEAFESCQAIINLPKPDSLLYHDVNCLTMICDEIFGLHPADSVQPIQLTSPYMARANQILLNSEKSGVNTEVLNKMRKSILFSKMIKGLNNKDYNEALKFGAQMLQLPISQLERLALEGNTAMIYYFMGNPDMALHYYEKALSKPAWHSNNAICLNNYMIILSNMGESQKAIDIMDAHPDIVDMVRGSSFYVNLLTSRGYALHNTGRFEEATKTLMTAKELSDSIHNEFKYKSLKKIIETAELQSKISKAQADVAQKDNVIMWLTIALTIVTAVLIGIIITVIRYKPRKNNIPASLSSNVELPANDSHSLSEENEALKALHLASLNETISSIAATIDDSKMADREKLAQINTSIKEISSYDDLWDIFHIQFEKLHPSFFRKLKATYPTLTQGETRMCAYVMLNMTNKEIAALTHRNIRSVETMRYRLTKKMNLPEGETLATRLATL